MSKCEKCDKEFKYKYLLKRHHESKFPCNSSNKLLILHKNKIKEVTTQIKEFDDKINVIENKINNINTKSLKKLNICLFCNKTFLNKTNMTKHIDKSCVKKKELLESRDIILVEQNKLVEQKNKLIKEQEEQTKEQLKERQKYVKEQERDNEIKELKNMIEKMIDKQSAQNITNNNITNNTINQTNNVIVINSFGKEDLSHITLQDYKKYLNTYFKGFINYIEKVHFDDNMPENHNICITNLKSKDIKVYDGDKWIAKPKTDIIDKFMRKKLNTLIDKFDELEDTDQITEKVVDNFSEFQVNYMDDKAKKTTKDDVILMIYNNKDKVKIK